MKNLLLTLACLCTVSLAQKDKSKGDGEEVKRGVYKNYSFDFSAHKRPIAYTTFGNALELVNKVKLSPAVAKRGGAYLLDTTINDKEFEIDIEFTIRSDLDQSLGFMALLTQHEMYEDEFQARLGYRQNYEGIGVYVFRHPHKDNKW